MKYENPEIPEGINVSKVRPLREILILGGGALLLLIALSFSFGKIAGYLAQYVPFEKEAALSRELTLPKQGDAALMDYLSKMTQRVIEQMELPEEMAVQVHYSTDTTINAYATLGGNVILFRGLMEKLPHENALAMLVAHEIAHIKHRDPITGLGSGIAIQLFLAVVLGRTEASILGEAGVYTMLHFSRSMEGSADTAALQALHRLYGHTTGATSLFEVIQAERKKMGIELPAFFQSHPLDQERIDRIQQISRQNGWSQNSETTPLPKDFERWLKVSEGSEQ